MAGPVDSLRPLCGVKAGERPTQAPPCLRGHFPPPLSLHYSSETLPPSPSLLTWLLLLVPPCKVPCFFPPRLLTGLVILCGFHGCVPTDHPPSEGRHGPTLSTWYN